MSREPWDDDRLSTAFAERAGAHPAPTALARTTLDAVRSGRGAARPGRWRGWLTAAAMVAVVVGFGAALALPRPSGPPVVPTHEPSAATAPSDGPAGTPVGNAPAPSPTDTVLRGILGLPVISVAEAAAIRDGGADDQEIAVRGWLASVAVPCPSEPNGPEPPFGLSCANSFAWLSSTPDRPGTNGPTGHSIRPVFQFADIIGSAPQEAVLIGHFADRRSASCPSADRAACREWFIVDRTGTSEASYLTTYLTGAALQSKATAIEAAITAESPDGRILSMAVLPAGGIGAVEPSIELDEHTAFDGIVWRAQVLEDGHATTYLFPDEGDVLYEMNPDGDAVPVSEPSVPTPAPSRAPWPPTGVDFLVTLSSEVGAGQPPVQVAVIDQSHQLDSVREPSTDRSDVPDPEGDPAWVGHEPGANTKVIRLTWTGGVCDDHVTVTINRALDVIRVDGGLVPPCDAMAVERRLVLTFDRAVDTAKIDVTYTRQISPCCN